MIELVEHINKRTGTEFIYTSSTISDIVLHAVTANSETLHTVFNSVFVPYKLKWMAYNNKIVIIPAEKRSAVVVQGKIIDKARKSSIPNTSIFVANANSGTVANSKGEFHFIVKESFLDDSLIFSFMGYETKKYAVSDLAKNSYNIIQLSQATLELPDIEVAAPSYKYTILGNDKKRAKGSIYMDTHGQQIALYIPNEDKLQGKIKSVQYFLCADGNTEAPFRVRLYYTDSTTNKPWKDLLDEFVIVYPNISEGWYTVDISHFNIKLPENGFYIAMEGIFPNEYTYYSGAGSFSDIAPTEIQESTIPDVISYGQRLGYTKLRKTKDNTWHFSLSRIWFQLRKNEYGAMINANIQYIKPEKLRK